ncbi:MAG: sulfonate ABC transporter ATP-binding protein [Paenibacillus sp. RIFOXYA1_FULL_44_5]|nr:MAG: sulfonate ABC transporter ATP-binding protein [Paenibacillus sp. RIFOXYA1_FULL_44_5]
MTDADVEIVLHDVSMKFGKQDQQITALKDIQLKIYRNEIVSLLGPSGCGKSTLLRLMTDLLQPTSGIIEIQSDEPEKARLNRKFGIVFQNPTLFEWRSARENIELPMEILGRGKKERNRISAELLNLVGLTKFADYYPWQLSGGMQQRVAIARALSLNPPILFMDEPFSALDEFTKERLHVEVLDIREKTNKTIVFVTHSIPEAVFLSDRIIVLSAHPGQIKEVVPVRLQSRRDPLVRESPDFVDCVKQVRRCFFEDGEI